MSATSQNKAREQRTDVRRSPDQRTSAPLEGAYASGAIRGEIHRSPASRARNTETIAPLAVSQETSLAVLGVDGDRYLRHLREHPEIPRRRVGRLIVSAVASWLPRAEAREHKPYDLDAAIAKAASR